MSTGARSQEAPREAAEHLGRYRLLARLGEGGMGAIHLAVTEGLGEFQKVVVLKELKPELSADKEFVKLFLREVRLAGRLNHPNIVHTIEAGQVDGRYFMTMEFLDGQPFSNLVSPAIEKSKIRTRLRFQILCDVLAGLHYAHELKDYDGTPLSVVHCDVSFSNVFITYEGQVKLVDFGVARVADTAHKRAGFQGKVRYAAPEQLTGGPIDRRADIYSVGVMLWECLTLRRFTAGQNSDKAIVDARLHGPEASIRALMPQLDAELVTICDRALSRDPAGRFATAEDFRKALSDYLNKIGPRVDAAEISQLMTTEFAAERAKLHGIISAQLRDTGSNAAPVQLPNVPNPDDPTTVADLSTLVESMSQVRPIVSPSATTAPPPAEPPRRSKLWIALGAVALGLSAVAAVTARSPSESLKPPTPQGEGTARVGEEAEPEAALEASEEGTSEAPQKDERAAERPPEAGAHDSSDDSGKSAPAKSAESNSTTPSSTVKSGSKTKASSTEKPSTEKAATTAKATSDKKAGASEVQAEPARAPATFGQDMAPRPKPTRTEIDSDNPFK